MFGLRPFVDPHLPTSSVKSLRMTQGKHPHDERATTGSLYIVEHSYLYLSDNPWISVLGLSCIINFMSEYMGHTFTHRLWSDYTM